MVAWSRGADPLLRVDVTVYNGALCWGHGTSVLVSTQ